MEDGNSPGAAFEETFAGCIHVLVSSDKSVHLHTLGDISVIIFKKKKKVKCAVALFFSFYYPFFLNLSFP